MQPGQTLDSIQGHVYGSRHIVVNIAMDCYAVEVCLACPDKSPEPCSSISAEAFAYE